MKSLNILKQNLQKYFLCDKRRIDFISKFLFTLIKVRTVNLSTIAASFPGKAGKDAHYKRMQRFFRNFKIELDDIACLIGSLLPKDEKWILTIDRTDWKFGKTPINILVLGIAYKGAAFPVIWMTLQKKGNSNTDERIALMERFLFIFGKVTIKFIVCDREFIGDEWFSYLIHHNINFRIRMRVNFKVSNRNGKLIPIFKLFRQQKLNEKLVLKKARILWGYELFISGMPLADGDYLIIVSPEYSLNAIEEYACRWQIETLFACLKTRGFNFEQTHMIAQERLEKLTAILAIAFAWAHITGEWLNEINPIKIKKHGRKTISIFKLGLDKLINIFQNINEKFNEFKIVVSFLSCT